MASFEWNKKELEKFYNLVDEALELASIETVSMVKERTPRDWSPGREPKPLPFKGIRKSKPYRKQGVTSKNGKWYLQVTGNLRRSIGYAKDGKLVYVVGVKKGPTEHYAATQEFGDLSRGIPSRSYLRETLEKDGSKIVGIVKGYLKSKLL